MSHPNTTENLEQLYETVREEHRGLTNRECADLAKELHEGNQEALARMENLAARNIDQRQFK